ncbi:MAG: hypothetical protein Q7S37_03595 [bacterium]|nr:hypothetical protein [bacterium]
MDLSSGTPNATETGSQHKWLIPIIIIVALAAFLGLYFFKDRLPSQYNDSQTYKTFSKKGISFQYPTEWIVRDKWGNCIADYCPTSDIVLLDIEPDMSHSNYRTSILSNNYSYITLGIAPIASYSTNSNPSYKSITLAGKPAKSYSNGNIYQELDSKYYLYIETSNLSKNKKFFQKIINTLKISITTAQLDALYTPPITTGTTNTDNTANTNSTAYPQTPSTQTATGYVTVFDLTRSDPSQYFEKEIWISNVPSGDYPTTIKLVDATTYFIGSEQINAENIQAEYDKLQSQAESSGAQHPQATVTYSRTVSGNSYPLAAQKVVFSK